MLESSWLLNTCIYSTNILIVENLIHTVVVMYETKHMILWSLLNRFFLLIISAVLKGWFFFFPCRALCGSNLCILFWCLHPKLQDMPGVLVNFLLHQTLCISDHFAGGGPSLWKFWYQIVYGLITHDKTIFKRGEKVVSVDLIKEMNHPCQISSD